MCDVYYHHFHYLVWQSISYELTNYVYLSENLKNTLYESGVIRMKIA